MPTADHPIRVGISGWRYPRWRGVFYPPGLPQRSELEHAASRLSTVEINGSFYSLQRPSSYATWAAQTPEDFVFAVKGSRFITHLKKLRDVDTALANFLASGVLALGAKLGPVLWQLGPAHRYDAEQLGHFLTLLPRTHGEAAALARGHDDRLRETAYLKVADPGRALEHVLEVRHPSFAQDPGFLDLMRRQGVGVVVADSAGRFPVLDAVTSDVVYVRLHGDTELYVSGYSEEALRRWAGRIRGWAREADVYVYLDNDAKVHAPHDAMRLAQILG
ncbi:DUF72 domain-containing protein [Ornithinimicrobium avium]|uniref:DUF72 domain-containing protein n=1 Tax=Ornithinimicrobium avium TaxID=2283195 RepID=A0A345NM89_9MICO|nr:DUF72 domain-containing protein [Ornithinimicrobium avium]AXH96147.1 DUF72 domain-containing protein [Ornithinimicrobium avium]